MKPDSRRVLTLFVLAVIPLVVGSCGEQTPSEPEDTSLELPEENRAIAFYNGNVITMNPVTRVEEAVLVRGSSIVATGSSDQIRGMAAPNGVEVDLEGRTLMPGFVDPHNHAFNSVFRGGKPEIVGTTYGEAQQRLLEAGTTTIGNSLGPDPLEGFLPFVESGELRVRTSFYLAYNDPCGVPQPEGWYLSYPPVTDPEAMFRIPGIKFFSDGGSCNIGAYSWRQPPGAGMYVTAEELAAAVIEVQELGYQAKIHTLGDVAVETALEAIETALGGGPNTYRHRMEHNRIIRPEQLPRYGEVGAIPVVFGSPFTCHILDGGAWHQLNDENSPAVAIRPWFDPWRALLDANPGLPVAWKSDAPSNWPLEPITHLWGLVTRNELRDDGSVCEAPEWLEAGGVTVEEALTMMTINAAYALLMDQAVGSLKSGKLADLIVLSHNPLTVDPNTLKDLSVLMTMVGGEVEHCMPGHEALCPSDGP